MATKVQWLLFKETRQLGCVFQDMELQKSTSTLRKSSTMPKPTRCVRFTKAVLRNATERDHKPSLNRSCPAETHQRSPNASKFEDRSQEETEWQEHWVREAASKLAKEILKLKEKHKATFFSLAEKVVSPFTIRNKTRRKSVCGRLQRVDAHD